MERVRRLTIHNWYFIVGIQCHSLVCPVEIKVEEDIMVTTTNGTKHRELPQHGVKGVFYGGDWLDMEDCVGKFTELPEDSCSSCPAPCPRSRSRKMSIKPDGTYDVVIIGAGCIGSAIARELSKYQLAILWLEAADDVSQGDRKSTRLNSSHRNTSRMPSSA